MPVSLWITWLGMPPTAPAMMGFPFHKASVTVRPKPSLIDFWTTMVDARCNALISSAHHGGKSRMMMSGSSPAASLTSLSTSAPSGSSLAPPPASTSWQSTYFLASLKACTTPHRILPSVETRHLGRNGARAISAEFVADFLHESFVDLFVL